MPYGTDRVGYGNCKPTKEEVSRAEKEFEKTERIINLKSKPSWHLTDSEKKELISYYGLD